VQPGVPVAIHLLVLVLRGRLELLGEEVLSLAQGGFEGGQFSGIQGLHSL